MAQLPILALIALMLALPGARLVIAARADETREAEAWLGLGFLAGSLGLPLRLYAVGQIAQASPQVQLFAVNGLGHALLNLCVGCLLLFTWRVFHPGSSLVRAIVLAMLAALAVDLVWILASGSGHPETHPSLILASALRCLPFPWTCFEARRYYKMLRRREALGLADPIVTNRFALWQIWTGTLSLIPLLAIALRLLARSHGAQAHPELLLWAMPILRNLMLSGIGIACVAIWLSFFPPALYTRSLLESRQSARRARA